MQLADPRRILMALIAILVWSIVNPGCADSRQPRMGVFTKPDAQVDLSSRFTDSHGEGGELRSWVMPGRPFILVPVFYRCPRLCGLTISGLIELINRVPQALGKDYSVVVYSFNPEDTVGDAATTRAQMLKRLSTTLRSDTSLSFLIADATTVASVNDQLGFRIRYADKELEHSSAIFVVSSAGVVKKYFTGVEFNPTQVSKFLVP